MRLLAALLAAAVLGGCDGEPPKRHATRQERMQAAEERMAKTPQPRVYRYADGELRSFQVLVPDGFGFTEQQQCFVWRDEVFRTASISCSVPPEVAPLAPN